jgi:hypothetical protein
VKNTPDRTEAARLAVALLDQFGAAVKPGRMEILDIDDRFCAAHGGQQLAFWNAHHDELGFASMHIYHVASCAPVAAILRPARTPKGTEVCTAIGSRIQIATLPQVRIAGHFSVSGQTLEALGRWSD